MPFPIQHHENPKWCMINPWCIIILIVLLFEAAPVSGQDTAYRDIYGHIRTGKSNTGIMETNTSRGKKNEYRPNDPPVIGGKCRNSMYGILVNDQPQFITGNTCQFIAISEMEGL